MKNFILPIALLTLVVTQSLEAKKPFQAEVSVGTSIATVSATNLVDLSRDLKTQGIQKLIPLYTPTSATSIGINLRGIGIISAFQANSTVLDVAIPVAGIQTSFTGGTRDDSIALFKEYLRDGGTKHKLLKAYARYSPIDPVAGNPTSLIAELGRSDYAMGRLTPKSGCDCCYPAQPVRHQFQVGVQAARYFAKEFDTTSVALPLQYSFSPDFQQAFIIDAPLIFHDNGGAYSLIGSIGLGYRLPVTSNWSLTPIVRWGSGASLDLATSGSFVSSGLTSVYNFIIPQGVIAMTNYASYLTSTNLWLSGVNFNYRIQSWVFKNGLSFNTCEGYNCFGIPLDFGLSFVDTQFTAHHLFIRHFDEVTVSLITSGINPCLDYDDLSINLGYQFGQQGFRGYLFSCLYHF